MPTDDSENRNELADVPAQREGGHEPPQDSKSASKWPWWLYGCQYAFFCLVFLSDFHIAKWQQFEYIDYLLLAIMGICLCLMIVHFIREFVGQHAQYGIKHIMLLTVVVAVLSSIYTCFGFRVLKFVVFIAMISLSSWARHKYDKPPIPETGKLFK